VRITPTVVLSALLPETIVTGTFPTTSIVVMLPLLGWTGIKPFRWAYLHFPGIWGQMLGVGLLLLGRLRREIELTADPILESLLREAEGYGLPLAGRRSEAVVRPAVAIPLRLASRLGDLSFLSTVTVFGTPIDVTLSEIALEMLYPADAATAAAVRKRRAARARSGQLESS